MNPVVSAIIPVYKVEPWLDACLESVLSQDVDLEAICVDDCSPDRCPAMLDAWAERDPRVRVLHLERNSGQGVARNRGMELARGTYVYFLDSDDMVAPGALAELVRIADEDELDGVFFGVSCMFDTPELEQRIVRAHEEVHGTHPLNVVTGLELYRSLVSQYDWISYPQRWIWRRSYLEAEGNTFPAEYSHEDELFSFRAILAARRVRYVPRPYFLRRYREGSVMTSRLGLRDLVSYLSCYVQMAQFVCERRLDVPEVHQDLARMLTHVTDCYRNVTEDGVDPLPAVRGTWLEDHLAVFVERNHGVRHTAFLGPRMQEAVRTAKQVYLYGAGIVGRKVHDTLASQELPYDSFRVSSHEGNPAAYQGHRVLTLDEAGLPREGAIVVITTANGPRAQIEQLLDERGIAHVYYRE